MIVATVSLSLSLSLSLALSLSLSHTRLLTRSLALPFTCCRVFMISVWRGEGGREEPELSTQHTIEITTVTEMNCYDDAGMQYSGTPLIKTTIGQVFSQVSLFARIVLGSTGKRCPFSDVSSVQGCLYRAVSLYSESVVN